MWCPPKCERNKCKFDCKKLTPESVQYARNLFENFATKGINDKIIWLSLFVRGTQATSTDTKIWCNYVRSHVQEGRESWSCSFCKCRAVPSAASAADPQHRFKQKKKTKGLKVCAVSGLCCWSRLQNKIVNQVRTNNYFHKYFYQWRTVLNFWCTERFFRRFSTLAQGL